MPPLSLCRLCRLSLVEKEIQFDEPGYAQQNPLPGQEDDEADGTSEEQQETCSQCQLLKKQLEQEVQHTARLQREVTKKELCLPLKLLR